MRCSECILECVGRSPLGGCINGEKAQLGNPDCEMYKDGNCEALPGLRCPGGPCAVYRHKPTIVVSAPDIFQHHIGHGPWEKGYQPADAMKVLDEKIKMVSERGTWDGVDVDKYLAEIRGADTELRDAALALVDAVERYVMGKCLQSELVNTKENLKKLISNEGE